MVNNYSIQSVTVSRKQRAGFLAGTALGLSLVLPAVPGAISTASAQTTNLLSVPLGYCAENVPFFTQLACGSGSLATPPGILNENPATAIGSGAAALAANSSAFGNGAAATNTNATATGANSLATGSNSTATGGSAFAKFSGSTATGAFSNALATGSTATGANSTASGFQ